MDDIIEKVFAEHPEIEDEIKDAINKRIAEMEERVKKISEEANNDSEGNSDSNEG